MKTLVLTLFLYFFLFTACDIYAGSNTITASYPAPGGSYNKLVLATNLKYLPDCTNPNNAGMLYMSSVDSSGLLSLQMCTNDGTNAPVPVTYLQTCFNRFCSWSGPELNVPQGCSFNGCPPGYMFASTHNQPIVDVFTTSFDPDSGLYYFVASTVCCSCGPSSCWLYENLLQPFGSTVNPVNPVNQP